LGIVALIGSDFGAGV